MYFFSKPRHTPISLMLILPSAADVLIPRLHCTSQIPRIKMRSYLFKTPSLVSSYDVNGPALLAVCNRLVRLELYIYIYITPSPLGKHKGSAESLRTASGFA